MLGPTGSKRIDTLVHDLVESSAAAGDIVQSEEIGGAMLVAARVHVRARVPRARDAARAERAARTIRADLRRTSPGEGTRPSEIVEFIAGMTDRFALSTLSGSMARMKDESVEAVKAAADFVDVVSARRPLRKGGGSLHGALPVPRGANAARFRSTLSTSILASAAARRAT